MDNNHEQSNSHKNTHGQKNSHVGVSLKAKIFNSRNIKRFLLISTVSLIVIVSLMVKATNYIEKPEFCKQCHSMKSYYNSWSDSTHQSVTCFDCHLGVKKEIVVKPATVTEKRYWTINLGEKSVNVTEYMNIIKKYVVKINEYVAYSLGKWAYIKNLSGNYVQFFSMFSNTGNNVGGVSWKNCSECHTDILEAGSNSDSTGHASHLSEGLTCLDCHGDVAHTNLVKPKREDCVACHSERLPKPKSHGTTDFYFGHGKMYNNRDSCRICHVQGAKEKLCMDCHGIEMPHRERYVEIHIQQIKNVGIKKCQECHEEKTSSSPGAGMSSSATGKTSAAVEKKKETTCSKCHGNKLLHRGAKALGEHANRAVKEGLSGCYACHKTNECMECHGVAMPHPNGFFAQHGGLVKKAGIEKCNTCHASGSQRAPLCYSCHGLVMPHPQEFIASHGEKDQKKCNLCHSPKNPANPKGAAAKANFCQRCHNAKPHFDGHWYEDEGTCSRCHVVSKSCTRCHL